jgi:hypothetical protein
LAWCYAQDPPDAALRLAGALAWFWFFQGHLAEGRHWLGEGVRRARARAEAQPWLPKVLAGAGQLAHLQGDLLAAGPLLEAAVDS